MAELQGLIDELSGASGDRMMDILIGCDPAGEATLRAALGGKCFTRLYHRALRMRLLWEETPRASSQPREHLIVIPALLGTELVSVDSKGEKERLWLDTSALVEGKLSRLRLADNGFGDVDPRYRIETGGLLIRYYGELMLSLSQAFQVESFAYDWRKSFDLAATELYTFLRQRFDQDETVHLVAVGEGGLIARLIQSRYPQAVTGKVLYLGTPLFGSFAYLQALVGHNELVNWVDTLDRKHDAGDFLALTRSMPSLYQLLPSPFINENWKELYLPKSYAAEVEIRPALLTQAKALRTELDAAPDNLNNTICIVGVGQPTVENVNVTVLRDSQSQKTATPNTDGLYELGDGDGRTARSLAVQSGEGIQTFYVDSAAQGNLLTAPRLLDGLADLLMASSPDEHMSIARRMGMQSDSGALAFSPQPTDQPNRQDRAQDLLADLGTTLADWKGQQSRRAVPVGQIASTEKGRMIEDVLASLYIFDALEGKSSAAPSVPISQPSVNVDVLLGDIADATGPEYDAIVVGNYLGEEPQGPFAALERSIPGPAGSGYDPLFSELIQRSTIRSELAALFLMPDPRPGSSATIVVAGQGTPGRFGLPELKVLVRELVWTLRRLGKHKIATVLLGDGRGGESIDEVIAVWMRGIKGALTGMDISDEPALTITFIQYNPLKVLEMDNALHGEAQHLQGRMNIDYSPLTKTELGRLLSAQNKRLAAELVKKREEQLQRIRERIEQGVPQIGSRPSKGRRRDIAPIRLHVEWGDAAIRFGALTSSAAIAERETEITQKTIDEENDALAASPNREMRARRGEILARLLLPTDLLAHITGDAPLVVSVDSTTARIHWELLRLPSDLDQDSTDRLDPDHFLGLGRGLTRQLRTSLAPRPEIVPPRKRQLRVLVVADPAADARLAGAQGEGIAVADLFEMVNRLDGTENRVEVVRMIGPGEATHSNVLGELLTRSYDVLHFAGHCRYDPQKPSNSGWLFTGDTLLTPQEIQRTGRMPAFVFSNACESGITPDRSGERSVGLAPSFAESFFAKGVTNFICTGWPVNDRAARDFALVLYAGLLGLIYAPARRTGGPASRINPACYAEMVGDPEPLYEALRKARTEIEQIHNDDGRSWGAYQHYGNPYARLFAPTTRPKGAD